MRKLIIAIPTIFLLIGAGCFRTPHGAARILPSRQLPSKEQSAFPLTNHSELVLITTSTEAAPITEGTALVTSTAAIETVISKAPSGKPPQFIAISFDGSKSLEMWQNVLDLSHELGAQGTPLHYSFFLSGVYMLDPEHKTEYSPPGFPVGSSRIGFADSASDVARRIQYMNQALVEGNDIGSHLNGHYDGLKWTAAEWQSEFDQFVRFTTNPKLHLTQDQIIGFRAPNLSVNKDLWPVLKAHGYTYDASLVGKFGEWPHKVHGDFWEFPLVSIQLAGTNKKLLSMDYNFYYAQTGAHDMVKKTDPEWQVYKEQVLNSYRNYFAQSYSGNRAPVIIGHHFAHWNDGVYWAALHDFLKETCGKPEVHCVSFKELASYLDVHPHK